MELVRKVTAEAECKIGRRPVVVVLDYIQLVQDAAKTRYEKVSNVAEEFKIFAKEEGVIGIILSQVGRKGDDTDGNEVTLWDAKGSGSIENSANLVIGAWRRKKETLTMRILKQTRGRAGDMIEGIFEGDTMTISEAEIKEPTPPTQEESRGWWNKEEN